MSEHDDRTSADIIADTVLEKDKSVRKLYAPTPRWPLDIAMLFAVLLAVSLLPNGFRPLGAYTQAVLLFGFILFIAKHLADVHRKLDRITAWISEQPKD